jgi:hypothetical protein
VEIFSAKIRVTPEARSESVWVSSDWRMVEARAYPIRTCPADPVPAATGRGSSVQAEPGLRTGGTGTLRALARWGTSRNRAVWYWVATRPLPVRHGDPAGAAQEDIGQSLASTHKKSPRSPADRFMWVCHSPGDMQRPMKRGLPWPAPGGRVVSQVLACETARATSRRINACMFLFNVWS